MINKVKRIKNRKSIIKYLINNPNCQICKGNGIDNIAVEVHHILHGTIKTDENWNYLSVCRKCHDLCHKSNFSQFQLFKIKGLTLNTLGKRMLEFLIFHKPSILNEFKEDFKK